MGRWARTVIGCSALLPEDAAKEDKPESCPSALQAQASSHIVCRYIWKDVERTATFPSECADDVAGPMPSAPSGGLRDYEDKLKAIDLSQQGLDVAGIAQQLGRSSHWVRRWWKQDPLRIPKPDVRHSPLVRNAPLQSFRDLELHRGFVRPADKAEGQVPLHEELTSLLKWEPARRATRHPETGDLRVRFDATGNSISQPGRFVAEYKGGASRLDALLQRVATVANIHDPASRVFLNRYEDGCATCPSHRHDFWTAMLSFGEARVAIVEERPLLLRHGDLLVFGTQSHGSPAMPDVVGRRVSVVVFFRPDASNLERRWQTFDQPGEDHHLDEGIDARSPEACRPLCRALVDSELCGCPGISLGLIARRETFVRAHVTIFTIGCGSLGEKMFFERLSHAKVTEIWDVRPLGVAAHRCSSHWHPDELRRACARRLLKYKQVPLGQIAAGGIHRHIASEEGQDVLARIVLAAEAGSVVTVMGQAEDWQECDRKVLAEVLASGRFGPVSIVHILSKGLETVLLGHPPSPVVERRHGAEPTMSGAGCMPDGTDADRGPSSRWCRRSRAVSCKA